MEDSTINSTNYTLQRYIFYLLEKNIKYMNISNKNNIMSYLFGVII